MLAITYSKHVIQNFAKAIVVVGIHSVCLFVFFSKYVKHYLECLQLGGSGFNSGAVIMFLYYRIGIEDNFYTSRTFRASSHYNVHMLHVISSKQYAVHPPSPQDKCKQSSWKASLELDFKLHTVCL